jgi:hypothetical protein
MKAHPGQNCDEYMIEKTKGAITNEQSRVISNIGYTRHNTKTNKANTKTQIRHEHSYKQLEVKTNQTSFLCGNRNGDLNTELGM